jgi:nitroreductase
VDPRRDAAVSLERAPELLALLLRHAVLAPSRHNSQPWLFEIEGPELRVYADERRALPAADPEGREAAMACGAALHNVEIAALHHGRATSVELLPAVRKDGLLARLTLEERRAPRPPDEALYQAIPVRRTNRLAFDAREPPAGLLCTLAREAACCGATLRAIEQGARTEVAELVAEGDRIEWSSARFRAEVAAWSRENRPGARDGMPGYAQGMSESAAALHRLLVRFHADVGSEERRDRHYALHTRALLVLSTAGDRGADWVAAGRAMQRVLLRATAHGLSASYFSQAVEVPRLRAGLREAIGERAHPQLLFRLGYGRSLAPTPRRPPDEVLRSLRTTAPERALMRPLEAEAHAHSP